ncbi:hypothetical protein NE865_00652 [Phthorimaea operculella]|nr:hypothetical protein NE865_00652 [Phthorimaea operculella]
MGRHKKRHRSPSTSSSSSSDVEKTKTKKYKKNLKKKNNRTEALEGLLKELRKTTNYHAGSAPQQSVVRYMGRNDFIPVFDPQTSPVSVEHWIRNLEGIANMHGWDERTLICNCTSKLGGYAKSWYEHQVTFDMSWAEWKEKLVRAFPFTKNKLTQIREMVNRVRKPNEDPIEFYYTKLGIGMSCQLSDVIITEAIIGTLGNQLLEIGAKSAGCRDTNSLLQYLASINTSAAASKGQDKPDNQLKNERGPDRVARCFTCGKPGHRASRCRVSKDNSNLHKDKGNQKCTFCGRPGHVEADCFKKKNKSKHCSFCNIDGHTLDECRKRSRTGPQNRLVRKVQTICYDASDKKYFKEVLVNGVSSNGYIDFGSTCNTMRQSFREMQNLELMPNDNTVIKGYGDGLTIPLGIVSTSLVIDGVEKVNKLYVVPDDLQEVDVLIGQPFTESPNLVIVKTSTELNMYEDEMAIQVTELCESFDKIRLYPQNDTKLTPGLNKVLVRPDPVVDGIINIKLSEQRKPLCEKDVIEDSVELHDGQAFIKLINRTNKILELKEQDCVARAELKDKYCDDNIKMGDHLNGDQKASLDELLTKYEHCFSGDGMELGNLNHIQEKDLIDALQDEDKEIQALMLNLKLEQEANKKKKNGLTKDYKVVDGRLYRVIENELRPVLPKTHMGDDQKGWDAYLPKVQLGLNSTLSQGTGKSPLELLCGLRPRLPNDLQGAVYSRDVSTSRVEAAQTIESNAAQMKTRYDKDRRVVEPLLMGQLVMVERKILRPGLTSGKLVQRYAGPYKVTAVLPNDRYEVTSYTKGKQAYKNIVARDKIKVWHDRPRDSSSDEDLIEQQ